MCERGEIHLVILLSNAGTIFFYVNRELLTISEPVDAHGYALAVKDTQVIMYKIQNAMGVKKEILLNN